MSKTRLHTIGDVNEPSPELPSWNFGVYSLNVHLPSDIALSILTE